MGIGNIASVPVGYAYIYKPCRHGSQKSRKAADQFTAAFRSLHREKHIFEVVLKAENDRTIPKGRDRLRVGIRQCPRVCRTLPC